MKLKNKNILFYLKLKLKLQIKSINIFVFIDKYFSYLYSNRAVKLILSLQELFILTINQSIKLLYTEQKFKFDKIFIKYIKIFVLQISFAKALHFLIIFSSLLTSNIDL